ncbi:hypothetical protein HDV06_005666 [Boothiomyces sp. JEL0866]|nr:hypothetical protein HDV06_005666 [Boothiomyces sp. JEL0866]
MINQLPLEMQDIIIRQLDGDDIVNLSFTSKYYYQLLGPIRSILEIIPNSWPILDLTFGDMEYFTICFDQLKLLKCCRFKFRHIQISAFEFAYLSTYLPPTQTMNLDFSGEPIGDVDYKELQFADYSKITTLEVSAECKGLENIFQYLERMKRLETIVINSGNTLDKLVNWKLLFDNIRDTPVSQLEIYSNGSCLEAFASFCNQLQNTKLRSISVQQCKFNDSHLIALSNALSLCELQELVVEECDVTDTGLTSFANTLISSNLKTLVLRGLNITLSGLLALAKGLKGSKLKTLDIHSNQIRPADWSVLFQNMENSMIESVGIYELDEKSSEALASIIPKSNLTHLVIPADSTNVAKLLVASKNSKILGIQICISRDSEIVSNIVEQHLGYITADTLYLDYNGNAYPQSSTLLCEIDKSAVRYLTLSNVLFNHQVLYKFSKQLPLSKLLSLALTLTNLDDDSLITLCSGVLGSDLRYMDFSCNQLITKEGIIEFVRLVKDSKIMKLNFRLILKYDDITATKNILKKLIGNIPLEVLL